MREKSRILLVEDDDVDVLTLQRALRDLNILNPLARVTNGEEALDYLRGNQAQKPGLILLDLNMPRMNGLEFLKIIKADEDFKLIPVVVLTTSREEQSCVEAFKSGVAGYMVKPVDYQKFLTMVDAIDVYWTLSEAPFLKGF